MEDEEMQNHAMNFFALLEFFIPLVRLYILYYILGQAQDYGIVIRTANYPKFRKMFNLIHICYSIFQNTEYLDAMGMQQLLWKYLESINHPGMKSLSLNFTNHIGEDIEMCNNSLGHSVLSKKGQSDVEHLSTSYRKLGVLFKKKSSMQEQVLNVRSLKGWTENKHMTYKEGDSAVVEAKAWIRTLIEHFRGGTYKHYKIPANVMLWLDQQSVLGKRKRCKSFQSAPTLTRDKERARLEFKHLDYILDYDWRVNLKLSLDKVLTRTWTSGNVRVADIPSAPLIQNFLFA